jgi:ketosteroid isomerase-like protein
LFAENKGSVMKKLNVLLLILIVGCRSEIRQVESKESAIQSLLKVDRAFSEMSVKKGNNEAFLYYAAPEAILLREKNYPVIGIKRIKAHLNQDIDSSILEWDPAKAEVSLSGDLGYTFGYWKYTILLKEGKNRVIKGSYITIWKKQPDGRWKFVVDGGSSFPNPIK